MTERTPPTEETYEEWQLAFDHFNERLFDGELPQCLITLQREKNTMGYFSFKRFANRAGRFTDEIALNPSYFAVCGVTEALQTLVHEMCHLWQYHFGRPGRGRYHNKEWADKMESIGLMPSSTGRPGGRRTGDRVSDYPIEGGIFLRSLEELKGRGFTLRWMDRYIPPPKPALAGNYQALLGAGLLEAQSQIDNQEGGHSESGDAIEHGESDHLAEIRELAEHIEFDLSRLAAKSVGRIKYTCGCGINIWAKPGISATCDECQQPFAEADS